MAYRAFYPYSRWKHIEISDEVSLANKAFVYIFRAFKDVQFQPITTNALEKKIFRLYKNEHSKPDLLSSKQFDFRNVLYTLLDFLKNNNIIHLENGNGWSYPIVEFNISTLWKVWNSEVKTICF